MKILIIEDETNAFDILRKRISQVFPEAEIVGHLKTILNSINWFVSHEAPDLVFLDVELADGQSFEIFNHIQINCPIIFTTAYDQYAIKAFTLNSVDYLLKPISTEDLQKAFKKFHDMKRAFTPFRMEHFQHLLSPTLPQSMKRLLVNSGEKYFFIKTVDIAYFYSEEGVTFLRTMENRRHLINETLDNLNHKLEKDQFFRINRHQIINIEAIETIHEYFNRRFKIELLVPLSEHEFIVSRLRRTEFKHWLNS